MVWFIIHHDRMICGFIKHNYDMIIASCHNGMVYGLIKLGIQVYNESALINVIPHTEHMRC